jgi:glycine/D-amino acid oxidase-like deaminating enzyme
VNLEPALHGELLGPLRDESLFRQVAVDPEVGAITWPNGADMDPSILYQWETVGDEFCRALQKQPQSTSS